MMEKYEPLRSTPGAITAPGVEPRLAVALLSNEKQTQVQIVGPNGVETLPVSRIDQDSNSDRLVLVTKTVKYNWRPLREADGVWLSQFKIPLPVETLPSMTPGEPVDTEVLSAYSSGDSPYVLGVVYETADGRWVRSGGSYLPMAADDTTYADMDRVIIAPEKAKSFLDLYDKNYVAVSDAAGYEAPDATDAE